MDISESNFEQKANYKNIAVDLNELMREGKKLGVVEGVQRVELICEQYKSLTPHTAYLWLNPNGFQDEIEEAQTHKWYIELLRIFRNIFSLAPLIMTWFGLFKAVTAYQQYILTPGGDKQASFLTLWQSGFNGQTSWTFTLTAILDVVLLSCYLLCLIGEHLWERWAHRKAAKYTQELQSKVDKLVKFVAAEGYPLITDQSDLDRTVNSIKSVVDSTTDSLRQIVNYTVDALNKMMEQNLKEFKQCVNDNTLLMRETVTSTAKNNETVLENTKKELELLFNTTKASMQQYIDGATDAHTKSLHCVEQTMQTALDDTKATMKQVADTAVQMVGSTKLHVDQLMTQTVIPMMSEFHQDMGSLHAEIANYQGRLNDLTSTSQQLAKAGQDLADASQSLIDNAERYISVGQDIAGQIAKLDATQQDVLSQIQMVAGGVSTAAGSMNTATTNMVNATKRIDGLTTRLGTTLDDAIQHMSQNIDQTNQQTNNVMKQLETGIDVAIQNMSQNVEQATKSLALVSPELQKSAVHLEQVTSGFFEVELAWPFRRKSIARSKNRASVGGQA